MSFKIDNLEYWVQRTLPLVYEDSMSYYELLNKVIMKLNEVIEKSNDYFSKDLIKAVEEILRKWQEDGTLDEIINQTLFGQINEDLDYLKLHAVHGDKIVSLGNFPRLATETTDSGRIKRAYDATPVGGSLHLGDAVILDVSEPLVITKKIQLFGNDVELKTVTPGMDDTLKVNGVTGFGLQGVRFNQNLMGRTSVTLSGCTDFKLHGLYFTRYSKEFSYYATDGGVRLENCKNGTILHSNWVQHGDQYDTATADLNRCISIQGNDSDNITIAQCLFDRVNQAIVVGSGDHIITANTFKAVNDNVLYMVDNASGVVFTANTVKNCNDEGIVIGSGTLDCDGNKFLNVPNKIIAISLNGTNPIEAIITNNTFDNKGITSGKLISWRAATHTVKKMIVADNIFNHPNMAAGSTEFFEVGHVDWFEFKDNIVDVKTAPYQRMIFVKGSKIHGSIHGNSFIGRDESSLALDMTGDQIDVDLVFENNRMKTCRAIYDTKVTYRNQSIRTDIGPYVTGTTKVNWFYSDRMPDRGTFKRGDIIWNTGNDYNVLCWRRDTNGSAHVLNTDWYEIRRYVPPTV